MTSIYSIHPSPEAVALQKISVASDALPDGYTSMVPLQIDDKCILYAYTKSTKTTDVYELSGTSPFLSKLRDGLSDLNHFEWDIVKTFIIGNKPYLLTYEGHKGNLGFYEIQSDYSLSKPYIFMNQRSWPTQNFSEVTPVVITGLVYVLCYDVVKGTVAIFSLDVISSSTGGIPPLNMLNVWYHQWAKGWQDFAFFQLGQSNFFFKINKAKLNVNIDHILDNPVLGTVEIGSWLQNLLPNAMDVSLDAIIPWANGEPYLVTYAKEAGIQNLNIYRIHSDCQGWTNLNTTAVEAATQLLAYRINTRSYILLYS